MAQNVAKDWDWLKAQYETGLPLRKIAALYKETFPGEHLTHQSLHQYATRHNWEKGRLSDEVQSRTRTKVIQRTAKEFCAKRTSKNEIITNGHAGRGVERPDNGKTAEMNEEEVLAINSDLATDVEFKHRDAGSRTLEVALAILERLHNNQAVKIDEAAGKVTLSKLSLGGQAKAVKDLAYTIDKAVNIERKSWNLDKGEGGIMGAGAAIQVNINIPEPKPLPERFDR